MIRLSHTSINHLFRVAILYTHDKSRYDDQDKCENSIKLG